MPRKLTSDSRSEYDDIASSADYDPTSVSTGGVNIDDYLDPDDHRYRRRQQRSKAQMWMIIGGVGVVGLWCIGLFATMRTPPPPAPSMSAVTPGNASSLPSSSGFPGTSGRPGGEKPASSPGAVTPAATAPGVAVTDKPPVGGTPLTASTLSSERRTQLLQGVVGIVVSGTKAPQKPGTQSTGTGFVVDARGYVVTSAQITQGKQQVEVSAYDGSTHKAQVIQRDAGLDIALLKVPTLSTSRPLALGDVSLVRDKADVYVLAYPLDRTSAWQPTLSSGTVLSLRPLGEKPGVQTDVMVDKGSTGGPVVLASTGEVIGVVTFKNGGTENKVTAQPINAVRGWLVKNIR